ncbi:caspase family protein [Bradyrhizobium sediminis]|uniref:Caspase family protein n=1 Tax=Bradyrhizobium sediminis TaxID=2840469 RepID=A0A975P431_9BRAD|nr:caspase family protein [Bradyrhizobium sediminis]QWG25234.1 caspase family protein [Bradyrhizobium sediminis]
MIRPVLRHTFLAAGILLGSQAALAENRVALVIGQSNYRAVVPLPNPANDAKAMSQMLTESGFEVLTAADLSQNELRTKVGDFAAKVAEKGPDTVALVFYAGHGLQIDGENFLVPVDVDPKRETDIPLQAVRLNDVLNTLASVPSKTRILLLDACRNNPFPDINKTAGRGLAIVDAKTGAPGTFMSFSTSPGAEAEDGSGANSPYTSALLAAAKEPGLSIEDTFKRVRVAVNKATAGRQTPWDSSSLTDDFRFVGPAVAGPKLASVKKTIDEWKRDLKGKPAETANELIVADGTDEAYEAFAVLYAQTPLGLQARDWLDRHRRMVAWNKAVIINTAAGYRAFIAQYPDSDLAPTARKLEERLRNRPNFVATVATAGGAPNVSGAAASGLAAGQPTNASLGPTCPCTTPTLPLKKVDTPPKKRTEPDPPKRVDRAPPKRYVVPEDDVVVYRRPPPRDYYEPRGPSIGIGIGIGGFGGGGGYGSGDRGGGHQGTSRSGY